MSPGVCRERAFTIVLYVSSVVGVITEWSLAFLPVYMAFKMLIMSLKDRVAIAVVLGMGALASIATIVRMAYLGMLLEGKADVRYMCAVIYMWATIENSLAISAACLATFRPLLARFLDLTVRKASIGDFSGRVLRKPSETTHAMTVSKRGGSCGVDGRESLVLDFSDRILADIDKVDVEQRRESAWDERRENVAEVEAGEKLEEMRRESGVEGLKDWDNSIVRETVVIVSREEAEVMEKIEEK
ncbi:hypothetical protein BDZ85DRAFT_264494 [Elsinoe ampelina]|uniref:Rhodopsin domain-containing protein n=1 Tax=Elsinoe ampelina TaxID=302913 RepID=A0A6A6G8G1_9PEZI|nr:hypothetical protein BDZ85DRAFT_264494 [Elsinoe ampelina]